MHRMYLLVLLLLPFCVNADCVILLHGLARSSASMSKLADALNSSGFATVNQSYPSREHNIETLAVNAINDATASCEKKGPKDKSSEYKIHFITHSMGGILVRQYLHQSEIENLGNVVMLGPPNKGSQVVDKLKNVVGFYWLNGPAGQQLGTTPNSVPKTLGAAHFTTGIIAGTRSINPILSTILPGQDDGKVTVANTKLDGMTDHITLPVTHTFMMKNDQVIEQSIHFIKFNQFKK